MHCIAEHLPAKFSFQFITARCYAFRLSCHKMSVRPSVRLSAGNYLHPQWPLWSSSVALDITSSPPTASLHVDLSQVTGPGGRSTRMSSWPTCSRHRCVTRQWQGLSGDALAELYDKAISELLDHSVTVSSQWLQHVRGTACRRLSGMHRRELKTVLFRSSFDND